MTHPLDGFVQAQRDEYAAHARHDPHPDVAVSALIREAYQRGLAEGWDEALVAVANERGPFGMQARNPYRERAGEAGC